MKLNILPQQSTPTPPMMQQNVITSQMAQEKRARAIEKFNGGQVKPNAQKDSIETLAAKAALEPVSQPQEEPVEEQIQEEIPAEGVMKAAQDLAPEGGEEPISEDPSIEPEKAKEETSEDKAMSSRYAQLARREKALRAEAQRRESEFKAREAALAAKEAEIQAKSPDMTKYIAKDLLKQNALQALAEANVSYEELTQQVLNQGSIDPHTERLLRNMEEKIQRLEKAAEESESKYKQAQDDQYKNAIKQIEADVKKLVHVDPTYEMIKATGSYKDVVELIEADFKENGHKSDYTIMTNEEAAQKVEDYLVEEAEKLAKIQKIQKRLMPAASKQTETAPVQKPGQTQKQPQQMKTLTNANSAPRQMTARERAMLAFKGQLK